MRNVVFVHGMFQNPKSWAKWIELFSSRGYNCVAPAWPDHEGEPASLRANPPATLGKLSLQQVVQKIDSVVSGLDNPILIGHSVGGLIAQIFLNRGQLAASVAISPVAPNRMMDFDMSFIKNVTTIINPLKGDEPMMMDANTFHGAFANTLSEQQATQAFEASATHDSRNVLRDCLGSLGQLDLDASHEPLLLISGEKDQIIPEHLVEKNSKAYGDADSVTDYKTFGGRSHYICGEPGWEEVAEHTLNWIERNANMNAAPLSTRRVG